MDNTRMSFLAALAFAIATPAMAQTPAPSRDPLARARAAFVQLQTGALDRSTLTPALNADLTEDVRASMTSRLASFGPPGSPLVVRSKSDVDGVTTYAFRLVGPSGSLDYVFGIDDATGKIAKLYFRPGPGS